MPGDFNKSYYGNQKINPDNYLDMSIKSIINLPNELMQNESKTFDINKYIRMKTILTEQLENIAVGMNKIKLNKKDYDLSKLNENEKELRNAIIDYYKKENLDIKIGAVPKSDAVMRFIIEGAYSTKINLQNELLTQKIKEGKMDESLAKAQISNLKLQLIIRAIQNSKVKALEIDV